MDILFYWYWGFNPELHIVPSMRFTLSYDSSSRAFFYSYSLKCSVGP